METRKRVWIAALCLLSAACLTIGLRHHVIRVQAATLPPHATLVPASGPAAQPTNASLRATALRNAMLLDDDSDVTRVTGSRKDRIVFPPVEQFTLTPPDPAQNITKTTVAVRFATGAEKLPEKIAMLMGTQHVTVQRSEGEPDTYIARVNFDWQAFAKEQELRKQAAANGKMVTIFQGRRSIRTEPMQFMEPAQIEAALESHQSLQLTPDMLTDGPVSIVPDHQLMITAIPVVEDPQRTFDQCLTPTLTQNPNGAWTFNTLMRAIACSTGSGNCTQQAAENMLLSMIATWQSAQTVNTFQVPARGGIGTLGTNGSGTLFLSNWPVDSANSCTLNGQPSLCPSLPNAPVHLNAIVNRIDIGQNDPPFPAGGELRFVFGVTASASTDSGVCSNNGAQPFNIILEYNVPNSFSATQWANVWGALQDNGSFDASYRAQLQTTITDKVVTAGACTNNVGAAISCLAQIRTNEITLATNGLWEQRQFQLPVIVLANNSPRLAMVPIAMTPDGSFNTKGQPSCGQNCNNSGDMGNWINEFQTQILASGGALPIVPAVLANGDHFLGGSAFNALGLGSGNAFWVDGVTLNSEPARVDFSVNTCNGCHGAEAHTTFQQVVNRQAGTGSDASANMANFLLGCKPSSGNCGSGSNAGPDTCAVGSTNQCAVNVPGQELVTDPNPAGNGLQTPFGDILRREGYLSGLLSQGTGSGGMLLPFLAQPVGGH